MDWLHKIVNDTLLKMSETPISMMTPAEVPEEMQDDSIEQIDDWSGWKPINSIIEDEDIDSLEREIGLPLPFSYREFLKTKHFFELQIPNGSVNLPGMLPDKGLSFLKKLVFETMEPGLLIGKGFIYFADFEDYGLLCFNTNVKADQNEYPVVFIDHEELDEIHPYADNFRALIEADEEQGNRFIDYLNEFYS